MGTMQIYVTINVMCALHLIRLVSLTSLITTFGWIWKRAALDSIFLWFANPSVVDENSQISVCINHATIWQAERTELKKRPTSVWFIFSVTENVSKDKTFPSFLKGCQFLSAFWWKYPPQVSVWGRGLRLHQCLSEFLGREDMARLFFFYLMAFGLWNCQTTS